MASNTQDAVEDLWGSGDEASDGAGDDMLQLPPDEPTVAPSSSGVERTSSKRGAPSDLPARRHIPSFQGAFSQARVQEAVGYSDGLKRQRLDNVGFSQAGTGPVRSAAQLTLPLTSSSLAAANIDLSSLPSLPDPLSTNYPDLPPDAARFLNSITESGASGAEGETDQDALARLSAALAESGHWPGLASEAASASPASAQAPAPAPGPSPAPALRSLRRRGDTSVPTSARSRTRSEGGALPSPAQPVAPGGEPMDRRGSGEIFLPPRSQLLPADERYTASPAGTPVVAQSPLHTPFASQPTTPHVPDAAALPSTGRSTRPAKVKGKGKVVLAEASPGELDADFKPAGGAVGLGGRRSKKRLPLKAEVDKVPSYRRMKLAAGTATEGGTIAVDWTRDGLKTTEQAQAASDAWADEVKKATTPYVAPSSLRHEAVS